MAMKKKIFAIPFVAEDTLVNPKNPATKEISKNMTANLIMTSPNMRLPRPVPVIEDP